MEFKGTKGKWSIDNGVIVSDSLDVICDCYVIDDEDFYNALLISKAPEMLEMLIELISVNVIHKGYHEKKLKAINLIKQATEI